MPPRLGASPARLAWLACVLLAGCATIEPAVVAPPPLAPIPSVPPGARLHVVQPRETLWALGQRYGVPHEAIMQANRLTDARDLPAGMTLVIPAPPRPEPLAVPLPPATRWTHLVIHHSATKEGNARLLDRAHRRRGFHYGLGYHFVIDNGTSGRRDGQLEVGPRWVRQQDGAHCNAGGMNHHGIGICLIGDFSHHPISDAQMRTLLALVHRLRLTYGIPLSRVISHRDVPGKATACPGDRFPWAEFKRRLSQLLR
ncbi:MAG TPA: N-acetylmuramoyl-L-alanine amidase [bacterium]